VRGYEVPNLSFELGGNATKFVTQVRGCYKVFMGEPRNDFKKKTQNTTLLDKMVF